MNINETAELTAFRTEVRSWIEGSIPDHLKGLRQSIVQGPGLSRGELEPLEAIMRSKGRQMEKGGFICGEIRAGARAPARLKNSHFRKRRAYFSSFRR